MYTKKITLLFLFIGLGVSLFSQNSLWSDVQIHSETENKNGNEPILIPNNARTVILNSDEMKDILWQANDSQLGFNSVTLEIPIQNGGFENYEVAQITNIFAENNYNKYHKTIRSFSGNKVGDPHTHIRMTLGYGRYNAVIYRPDGTMEYVEYSPQIQDNTYFVYRRGDADINRITCHVDEAVLPKDNVEQKVLGAPSQKSFRLQLTTSKSFSQRHAPTATTKAQVQTVITSQINDILNPIYNRDFGVIFTNATIDESIFLANATGTNTPFSDEGNSLVVLNENSVFCNQGQTSAFSTINNNNYDVGHAQVGANSGGVATGASVCNPFTNMISNSDANKGIVGGQTGIIKSEGMSGIDYPLINDFTVDYLAHELGHQFGCNHTYATVETGANAGCDTGEASARYEVGSGTTIMAYVNVCNSSNVYPDGKTRSDPFFHSHSIDEAVTFLASPEEDCSSSPGGTNAANPVVTPEAPTMSIPKGTPFALVGTVTDSESSSIVAAWNQFDLAANNYDGGSLSAPKAATTDGAPLSTNTSGPLFRFQVPTAPDGSNKVKRIFPSNGQTGGTQSWEVIPTVARTMVFRLTGRDNQTGTNFSQFGRTAVGTTTVTVTNDGPMAVTTPTTNQDVPANSNVDVNISGLPNSICSNVDLFISTDGGANYSSTALATNVANTGTFTVTIPASTPETSDARILVQCATASGELFGNCTVFQISPSFNVTAAILPVDLEFFNAQLIDGKDAQLVWQTATEINNEGFDIERSKDGISFEKIGFVRGNGNSETNNTYRFSDKNLDNGKYYYRLKQLDSDGQFAYSNIETVMVKNENALQVFPNPADNQLYVNYTSTTTPTLYLFNTLGQKIPVSISQQEQQLTLDLSDVPTGVYFLHEAEAGFISKFIKR